MGDAVAAIAARPSASAQRRWNDGNKRVGANSSCGLTKARPSASAQRRWNDGKREQRVRSRPSHDDASDALLTRLTSENAAEMEMCAFAACAANSKSVYVRNGRNGLRGCLENAGVAGPDNSARELTEKIASSHRLYDDYKLKWDTSLIEIYL
ncbi:hypothetical protein QE152_g38406 [Popillia japonica]|uniref:Uncharacterized protein n=1 Tax=Popillia japonica TaxID=7064 RepID=A0AAW1HWK9_POPJA